MGNMMVPARVLAQALGGKAWWDENTQSVKFQSGTGPIQSGTHFITAMISTGSPVSSTQRAAISPWKGRSR